jgi:hypothetical protein
MVLAEVPKPGWSYFKYKYLDTTPMDTIIERINRLETSLTLRIGLLFSSCFTCVNDYKNQAKLLKQMTRDSKYAFQQYRKNLNITEETLWNLFILLRIE